MGHLPVYLWVATFIEAIGFGATTVYALYRGARAAGRDPRAAAKLAAGAAATLTVWFTATAVIAGNGLYHTRIGHGIPWLPIAVLGTFTTLLLLSQLRPVAEALEAPGALERLMWPHTLRIGGAVFVAAMLLNRLPALFAIPAGVGDMLVAVMAPAAVRRIKEGNYGRSLVWFSALGIADLVSALTLGALTGFQIVSVHPSAGLNSELPLALIPTAGVPLLMALHVTTLRILFRPENAASAGFDRNNQTPAPGGMPVATGEVAA
jgi:hypothetical protein